MQRKNILKNICVGAILLFALTFTTPAQATTIIEKTSESKTDLFEHVLIDGKLFTAAPTVDGNVFQIKTENLSYISINLNVTNKVEQVIINDIVVDVQTEGNIEKALLLYPGYNDIKITAITENGKYQEYQFAILNDCGDGYYKSDTLQMVDGKLGIPQEQLGQTIGELKSQISTYHSNVAVINEKGKVKDNTTQWECGDIVIIRNLNNQALYYGTLSILGDIDGDSNLTDNDLNEVKNAILAKEKESSIMVADLNQDGFVSAKDLGLIHKLLGTENKDNGDKKTIDFSAPSNLFSGKSCDVSLILPDGNYCAEGYLTYNTDELEIEDVEDDGKIHFVTEGNLVTFENGSRYLTVAVKKESGATMQVTITDAYDYEDDKTITIKSKKHVITTGIEVSASVSKKSGADNKVELTITNVSNFSIGKIVVVCGNYMAHIDGENIKAFNGVRPNQSQVIELDVADSLVNGKYRSSITIQYHNYRYEKSTISIPVTLMAGE